MPYYRGPGGVNKQKRVETMKLEEMELALARFDAMIGILKKQVKDGTNLQAAEDMARLQQWRDDLDIQIKVERIKQDAYHNPMRPSLHS